MKRTLQFVSGVDKIANRRPKEKGLAEANPLIFIAILYLILVGRGGLEPPTNGLKVRCSTN